MGEQHRPWTDLKNNLALAFLFFQITKSQSDPLGTPRHKQTLN